MSAEAPIQLISNHGNYSMTGESVAEHYECSLEARSPDTTHVRGLSKHAHQKSL